MNDEWYVAVNGQQYGPYSMAQMGEMLASGNINRQSLVWKNGIPGGNWTAMEAVAELQSLFAPATPMPPPIPTASLMPMATAPTQAASVPQGGADNKERLKKVNLLLRKRQLEEAFSLLEELVDEGYTQAQYLLGFCLKTVDYGKKDSDEAEKWLRKAVEGFRKEAEQGDTEAQRSLGDCYRDGDGVKQDYAQAVEWYRKAADQGDADAQYWLGQCYRDGRGVKQDYAQAAEWYQKSADQGNYLAESSLDVLKRQGKI